MSAEHLQNAAIGRLREVHAAASRGKTRSQHPKLSQAALEGRVPLRGVNLRGDDQADRSVHGGPDKAVYAYAAEDIETDGLKYSTGAAFDSDLTHYAFTDMAGTIHIRSVEDGRELARLCDTAELEVRLRWPELPPRCN